MNFWEAYERMMRGQWCQAEMQHSQPYRFFNGRWETIENRYIGPAVWSEEWQHDTYSQAPFIVEWNNEYGIPIHFSMEELDAGWVARYDLKHIPREEDRPEIEPTPQQAALNEKRKREAEERLRLNPPISITLDAMMHDRTGDMLRRCQEISSQLADKETREIAKLITGAV